MTEVSGEMLNALLDHNTEAGSCHHHSLPMQPHPSIQASLVEFR